MASYSYKIWDQKFQYFQKKNFFKKQNGAQDRVLDTVLIGAADDRWSGHSPHANSGRRKENPDPEDGVDEIEFAEFYIGKMMSSSQLKNLPANQKMVVKVSSKRFSDSRTKRFVFNEINSIILYKRQPTLSANIFSPKE